MINNHGDIILFPIKTKKPFKTALKGKIHILQQSDTTGNRHQVESEDKPIYKWTSKGVEYIHCDSDYEIKHIGGDCEHGVQPVGAGTREIRHELEHDPWSNELRIVVD